MPIARLLLDQQFEHMTHDRYEEMRGEISCTVGQSCIHSLNTSPAITTGKPGDNVAPSSSGSRGEYMNNSSRKAAMDVMDGLILYRCQIYLPTSAMRNLGSISSIKQRHQALNHQH